jgi:hypothetical protein
MPPRSSNLLLTTAALIAEAPRPADFRVTGEAGRDLSSALMRAAQMTN